jgi:hypothetical protein
MATNLIIGKIKMVRAFIKHRIVFSRGVVVNAKTELKSPITCSSSSYLLAIIIPLQLHLKTSIYIPNYIHYWGNLLLSTWHYLSKYQVKKQVGDEH